MLACGVRLSRFSSTMKIAIFLGLMLCLLGLVACTPWPDQAQPKGKPTRAPMDRPGMKGRKDLL